MQINRAASMQLESIGGNMPISKAAERMMSANVGLLLVADGTRLIGVVTDRDIVLRAAAVGKSIDQTAVREIMSSPVACIDGHLDLKDAAKMMTEKKIRRLVVVNDLQQPVGVLSLDDIAFSTHGSEIAAEVLEDIAQGPQGAALFR